LFFTVPELEVFALLVLEHFSGNLYLINVQASSETKAYKYCHYSFTKQ